MPTDRKPLVYVAGPITRDPFGCVRQAIGAYNALREQGCVPFLPQLSVIHEMVEHVPYDEWLSYDFDMIRHCDALLRLPGESPGADLEVAFARSLGIDVFFDYVKDEWLPLQGGPCDPCRSGDHFECSQGVEQVACLCERGFC